MEKELWRVGLRYSWVQLSLHPVEVVCIIIKKKKNNEEEESGSKRENWKPTSGLWPGLCSTDSDKA